jgi:hypothetical protein
LWSLLRGGRRRVHALDQDFDASRRRAMPASGLSKCKFETVNVFDWLKAQTVVKPSENYSRFDLIILDPPSFTRNRASVPTPCAAKEFICAPSNSSNRAALWPPSAARITFTHRPSGRDPFGGV